MKISLSIIIPVYNAEKYIEETIFSVLNQSLTDIEIICVDDESNDKSRDIIESIMRKDARLKLLCQENSHAGIARNNGLKTAQGEYIHFLDADDILLPYGYEAVIKKARKYDLDVIKFSTIAQDAAENKTIYNDYYENETLKWSDFDVVMDGQDPRTIDLCVTPWSGIYRRTFLTENNILFNDLICVNDRSFYKNVILCARRIMITKDRVIIHRVNVSDSLVDSRTKHFICHEKSIRIIDEMLDKKQINQETRDLIMDNEFDDLMIWFVRSLNSKDYRKETIRITGKLLKQYKDKYPVISKYEKTYYIKIIKNIIKRIIKYKKKDELKEYQYFFEKCENPIQTILVEVDNVEEKLPTVLSELSKDRRNNIEFVCLSENLSDISISTIRQFSDIDHRFRSESGSPESFTRNYQNTDSKIYIYDHKKKECFPLS